MINERKERKNSPDKNVSLARASPRRVSSIQAVGTKEGGRQTKGLLPSAERAVAVLVLQGAFGGGPQFSPPGQHKTGQGHPGISWWVLSFETSKER